MLLSGSRRITSRREGASIRVRHQPFDCTQSAQRRVDAPGSNLVQHPLDELGSTVTA